MDWHLSKQAVNDLAIGDGGGTRDSRDVGAVRIDPEGVVNRGGDVFRSPGASDGTAAVAVGGSDDGPSIDGTSRHQDAAGVGVMVASRLLVDAWRATEFAHHHDQGGIEAASLFEVVEQR